MQPPVQVMPKHNACSCSVTAPIVVAERTTHQRHTDHVYGYWMDSDMELYLGMKGEGGKRLATAGTQQIHGDQPPPPGRNHAEYGLRIEPNVDVAMCVLVCSAYDDIVCSYRLRTQAETAQSRPITPFIPAVVPC